MNRTGLRRVILAGSGDDDRGQVGVETRELGCGRSGQPSGGAGEHARGGLTAPVLDARFAEFYERDYSRLVASLTLVTGDRDRARDAVDEAVARACERLSRGRTIDELGAWVRVVALNFARGRFRKSRNEARARLQLGALGAPYVFSSAPPGSGAAIDVQRALMQLPRRQREITVLRYYLDLSVAQISEQFGIAEGTVKSALHSARATLSTLLTEKVEIDDRDEVNNGIA